MMKGTEIDTVAEMQEAKWYVRIYKKVRYRNVAVFDDQIIDTVVVTGSFVDEVEAKFVKWFQGDTKVRIAGTRKTLNFTEEEQNSYKELGEKLYVLRAEQK